MRLLATYPTLDVSNDDTERDESGGDLEYERKVRGKRIRERIKKARNHRIDG